MTIEKVLKYIGYIFIVLGGIGFLTHLDDVLSSFLLLGICFLVLGVLSGISFLALSVIIEQLKKIEQNTRKE